MNNNAALKRPNTVRKTTIRRPDGFTTVVVNTHNAGKTSKRVVTFSVG